MRKITFLLAVMAVFWTGFLQAESVKTYFVNQNFTGVAAHPTGWSSTNDANYSLFGTSGTYNYTTPADQLNITGPSYAKNLGLKVTFPASNEPVTYVDFDWTITSAVVGAKNALALYLVDNVAAAYTGTGDIMVLFCSGTDGKIHCQNIDNTTATFQNANANGIFLKGDAVATTCNSNTASTITSCPWAAGQTIHVTATLDFAQHKITYLKISNSTTNLTPYENTLGLNFISSSAANVSKICLTNTYKYGSIPSNGSNVLFNVGIDNFKTYKSSDLGTLSSNSPQCANTGVTLTCSGAAPSGQTYYWQTSATGTSTSYPTSSIYTVTTSGNYYVRSLTTTGSVWSEASSAVSVTLQSNAVGGTAAAYRSNLLVGDTTTIRLSGYTGSSIQWQSSTDGTNYLDISNATSSSYITPNLTPAGVYYYRAKVTTACTAYSSVATVTSSSNPVVNASTWTFGNGYFTQVPGSSSAVQTFTVSGSNLSGDIVLAPPANFEISSDNTNFINSSSSLTLTQSGGVVNSTTIYVRLVPTAMDAYSGNITINTTGGTTQNMAVSGHGLTTEPSIQPNTVNASSILQTSMNIGWNVGSGANSIVLYSTNSDVASAHPPVDGTTYTAGTNIATGYNIGYIGTGNSVSLSGLSANTTYYFAVFTFDDNSITGAENYNVTSPAFLTQVTLPSSTTSDYFRSRTTGTWSTPTTWESSTNGSTGWHIADIEPANTNTLITTSNLVTITTTITPTGFSMANGSTVTLQTGANFSKAIVGATTGSGITLIPSSNVTYSSPITVASTVNYTLSSAGSVNTSGAYSSMPTINNTYDASLSATDVNVSSTVGSATLFGSTITDFSKVRLSLSNNVNLVYAANGSSGTNTINIGKLTGTSSSKIKGGRIGGRTYLYSIGGLNESSTFDGTVENFANDFWGSNTSLSLTKTGTGSLTLSGASTGYTNGAVTVNGGTLTITGTLGSATTTVTTTVGASGTLNGTGTVNTSTTINGTLSGNLTFGSSLTLAGTTNLNVTNFTGTNDVITVIGTVTNGGTLNITLPATAPAVGTNIKLINAGSYSGIFATKTLPSGYRFDDASGTLYYDGTTISSNTTLTTIPGNGVVTVNGGELTINQNATLSSLTVAPGAKVTLNSGKTLTATTVTLQSDPSGNATFVDADATGSAITATVQQYLPQGRNWYVSIPVTSGSATALTAAGLATSLAYYDEPSSSWVTNYTGALTPGKGYIAVSAPTDGSATNNASFSGTLNTGNVTVNLTRKGTNKAGFNLVANPYPSYLNAMKAINANSNMEQTIWYRTCSAGGTYFFETVNTASGIGTNDSGTGTVTGYVPPMQAFWVRTLTDANSITFTNTMRYHAGNVVTDAGTVSTTAMKTKSNQQSVSQLVRLQVSNGVNSDETVIYTNDNAANSFDAYDSQKMSNVNTAIPEIYTVVGNENLVINGLNSIQPNMEIPLGFTTGQSNTFTIKASEISNLDAGTSVILRDNQLNTEQELTATNSYNFISEPATTATRFSIVFKTSSVTTSTISTESNQSVEIYKNVNNQIIVSCESNFNNKAVATIYNALGQKLAAKQLTSTKTVFENQFGSGVYLVTVNNGGKMTTNKIVLK